MDNVLIGRIVKPQGVKGELKVMPLTTDNNRFKNLSYVIIKNNRINVLHSRVGVDGFCYLTLTGITDRNLAETLRDCEVFVEKADSVKLRDNEFFIDDLMNCKLLTENGKELGKVINIENYGSADIITVSYSTGMKFSFANVYGVIVSVDANKKIAIINEKKLKEVRV